MNFTHSMDAKNDSLRALFFFALLLTFSLQQVVVFHWLGSGVSLGTLAILLCTVIVPIWLFFSNGIPKALWLPLSGIAAGLAVLLLSALLSDHLIIAIKFAVRYGTELVLLWLMINLAVRSKANSRAAARATIWLLWFALAVGLGKLLGVRDVMEFSLHFHTVRALAWEMNTRISGIYPHPGIFGSIAVMAGVLSLHLWHKKAIGSMEMVLGILAAGVALALSQTRNPALALLIVGPVALMSTGKIRIRFRILAVLGILAAVFALFWLRYRTFGKFEHLDSSIALFTTDRIYLWKGAFHAWQDHFWFGTGPGVFQYLAAHYTHGMFHDTEHHAHNLVLGILSETGLVGYVAFSWLMFATFFPLYRATRPGTDRRWINTWLILLLSFGIADFYFFSYGFSLHCLIAVALLYGEYLPRSSTRSEQYEKGSHEKSERGGMPVDEAS